MEFQREPGRIYAMNADALAAEIDHTFVDSSLRGQGVAEQLVRAAVDQIRAEGKQARVTCSYARAWFEKHPEEADLRCP